jgi:aryl-alcohol dehydrogenase-like predicted oxidoreductase
MQSRALGRTGRSVGVVGFAGAPLVTPSRERSPSDVQRALAAALEHGVDLIEVPEGGEALVRDPIREMRARDRAIVMIEVAAIGLRARIEAALRGTRLEIVPLVMVRGKLAPGVRAEMGEHVRAGKVMHWGAIVNAEDPIPDDVDVIRAPRERALPGAIVNVELAKLEETLNGPSACALLDLVDPDVRAHVLAMVR